ncbi:MAG: glycosyltransferase 87 family protein [Anaerolineales bacterium]|nr:glycosyltransferase 87 family protein [Anaerolineales bacterium]
MTIELGLIAFCLLSGVWRGSSWLIPAFFLPTSLFFAFLIFLFRSLSRDPSTAYTRWIIFGFAALFHITMVLSPHPLSNDLYRYLWDGKILANGINPYTYAPLNDALTIFRDSNWELIFNRDISTGYPPLIEILFAANHLLKLGGFGIRLLSVISSLGVCVVLMRILRHLGDDERKVIVYAWSPLVALEFGNSGHFDAVAILALALAFLLHIKGNKIGTAIFLALGGLIKFFPALLAPIWGRRWGWRSWSVFFLVFILPWVPFLSGGNPFTGLGVFASRGDFNASLSALIQILWGSLLQPSEARLAARLTSLLILVLVGLILAVRLWRKVNPKAEWRYAFLLMGWSLLLSPVVHPWYICWMLAFIVIEWEAAWLVLSASVIFARHVYLGFETTGVWRESMWPRWAVYLPFYLTYFIQRVRRFSWKSIRNMVHPKAVLFEGKVE